MKNLILEHIDKSNWKSFPFEKIAKRVAETVDPNKTDLDIYYGLEHLDSDDIHIRRNGTPYDVSGGKLKCYPGDVIFGKRRAYQRKAGIVKQLAICSAHAFVFRANEEIIDASLFPFFLHSDHFMHQMVDISVGGLSPTVNWSDLKHQEFLLPPKAQQAELVELLWALDEVIEKDYRLLEKLNDLHLSVSKENFVDNVKNFTTLGECAEIIMGQSPAGDSYNQSNIGTPLINGPTEFTERYPVKLQWTTSPTKFCLEKDILLCVRGSTTGRINISDDKYCIGRGIAAIRGRSTFRTEFLEYALKFNVDEIMRISSGSTFPNIDRMTLKSIKLPKLNNHQQNKVIEHLTLLEKNKEAVKCKLASSKDLQKALINQLF